MYQLSKRLKKIADLVPRDSKVCDVGTDHGYLPIYLSHSGIAKSIIALDIREKPLLSAKLNISQANVNNIDLRLCDGLSGVNNGEADTVIIAGMGGEVIADIIKRCCWAKNNNINFIFQPMTSSEYLRKYLYSTGYEILNEYPVSENGKVYTVMSVKYTGISCKKTDLFYFIGKVSNNTVDGINYIVKQYERCNNCANSLSGVPQMSEQYNYYKEVADSIKQLLAEK